MKNLKQVSLGFLLITWIFFLFCITNAEPEKITPKIIDNFDSLQGWKIFSEGLKINTKKGIKNNCICLNYDLKGNREWVVTSKKFTGLTLPKNYKISFYLKGTGARNNLEFKLIDNKGNVFWKKWENFKFPTKWDKIIIKRKDIAFAWGPDSGAILSKIDKIEFSISKGLGGKGKVFVDELTLIPRDVIIQAKASSFESSQHKPENVIDGNKNTRWSSQFSDPQWLEIDFGEEKEFIGIILYWEAAYAKAYDILLSKNGEDWIKVYSTTDGKGGIEDIDFKKRKARYVKIYGKQRGTYYGYSLFEVVMKTAKEPWGEGEVPDVILKKQWYFKIDPENIGEKKRWYSLYKNKGWIRINTGAEWEKQGFPNYDGIAWYKTMVYIPDLWESANPLLLLNDIYNEYKLYINGKLVKKIKNGTGINIIKIKKYIKTGGPNLFVLRVNNYYGKGGIKGATLIIKDEQALKNKIRDLKQISYKQYYHFLAEITPGGYFPYWLKNGQGFWTVVGLDKDFKESLFCEDGTIEPYKSFSISPFLYVNNKLITRGDVKLSQYLEKNYLPLPVVKWEHPSITMEIKVFPYGEIGKSVTYAWYKIKNKGKKTIRGKLFLTFRPFEINPPWQWGGFHKVYDIKYQKDYIQINKFKIMPLSKFSDFGVAGYKDGDIISAIKKGDVPSKKSLYDRDGFASGGLEFQYKLSPGKEQDFFIAIPLYNNASVIKMETNSQQIKRKFIKMFKENIKFWESKLDNKIEINIPDTDIIDTLKANLAYIFINKDGPAIQPGSRAYEAAWIRDGAMTSAALLRMGYYDEVKEYLNWYSNYLYKDGRVPAIVIIGRNEINPVKEYDSQGELIYAMLQYYYFTKDKQFLKEKWQVILKSLKYLEYLRNRRITDKYKFGGMDKKPYYGILPNSVSHEGYYPEPGNHSYWDDFWAIKGWKDAKIIAKIIGKYDYIDWIEREEKELRESVYKSIKRTMKYKHINYIPGCAELGDFDPTSTAIAIMVCDELESLPQPQLRNTFDKYYNDFSKRLNPAWTGSFTPYEVRSVQAFLYMNQKERALKLLKYLLNCRRPAGWKHWAEVVYYPYRQGGYIGDMPHTWVGGGYINTVRSMFVYEKDDALILGAGIDEEWLDRKEGISVKNMPTYFGKISYTMRKEDNVLSFKISGKASPKKGFVFKSPFLNRKIKSVSVNSRKWKKFTDDDIYFNRLPSSIKINY